jgi:hypothetical protein
MPKVASLWMSNAQHIERRRLVGWAMRMTQNTPIAASWHERKLLAKFVQGSLTIDQVIALLENVKAVQAI